MAVLDWVILCERVILEERARAVSMISILENIQLPTPPEGLSNADEPGPVVPLRFFVVQQWTRSKPKVGERLTGRVRLVGPASQFGARDFLVDLTGTPRARIISQTIGFPLQGEGRYRCIVEANVKTKWRKAGETEFNVVYVNNDQKRRN